MKILGIPVVLTLIILVLFSTNSSSIVTPAYAINSANTYTLSAGERPFNVSYSLSNATLAGIYLNKTDVLLNTHYLYSIVAVVTNVAKTGGILTITMPLDLMASGCNFLPTSGGEYPVLIHTSNGASIGYNAHVTSITKTNYTILVDLPDSTASVEIPQFSETPEGGCLTYGYQLMHNNKVYWLDYISCPPILNIKLDENNPALLVTLGYGVCFINLGGSYTDIQIPRDVLDARMGQKDIPFTVTLDGNMTQVQEIETTNATRTIHIPITNLSPTEHAAIVITGTTEVPEFPTTTIVAVSAIGMAIIFGRDRLQRRLYGTTDENA